MGPLGALQHACSSMYVTSAGIVISISSVALKYAPTSHDVQASLQLIRLMTMIFE